MHVSRSLVVAGTVAVCLTGVSIPPAWAQAPAVPAAQAPAVPAGRLTLEQILELADARSESIQIAQAGVRRAEGEQIRARSALFPQLSLSTGYDRTLATQFSGIFDDGNNPFGGGGDGNGGTETPDDGSDDSIGNLPFGQLNAWQFTASFSQNVYSGGRIGAQRDVARIGLESAQLGVNTARGQLLFDVTQAYYDAALSGRLVAIAEATLEQAGATLQQAQAMFDAGTQPEFELLRARVNRDNQQPLVIRQRVNRDVAMLRLKQLLDLPADAELELADTLADEQLTPAPVFAARVIPVEQAVVSSEQAVSAARANIDLPARTAVSQVETAVRQSEAALRLTEAARMPSLALNSTYQRVSYPSNPLLPTFGQTNWTIGASVQLPVLTGGRQRGDEAVARATLEQAQLQLRQAQELASVDTRSAWAELAAARAAWEATAGTVQQANRAYTIADVRFGNGVSTQLELSDSRLLLQQAEANRALAARDLQVARARVALLPDLPIGAGSTAAAAAAAQRQGTPQATPQPGVPQQNFGGGTFTNASAQQGQAGTR